ncbi:MULTISPECIES: hypothetical protein [Cupriavidus]|uniref:hypothetical protein n=1 Tax=Cupriavidus TaxID=106589 RepID=UPI0011C01EE0|nr:hypothetical protein [Cupriavidus taiwanensis]
MARWILNGNGARGGLHNPNAPLTTLEILVSSEQGEQLNAAGAMHDIERASMPLASTAGSTRYNATPTMWAYCTSAATV